MARLHERLRWIGRVTGRVIVAGTLVASSLGPSLSPSLHAQASAPADEPLTVDGSVVGRHYRQAGGGSGQGFDVTGKYFDKMVALGGVSETGYPISSVFPATDGCRYQAFQKLVLQECKDGPIDVANTFQILEEAGADGFALARGIKPADDDKASSADDSRRVRLTWLENKPIAEYFIDYCGDGNVENAWRLCGFPMGTPYQFKDIYLTQRFQRIVFQLWQQDGPAGIRAGQITVVNGGDLLKQADVLVGPAIVPHEMGKPPVVTEQVSFQKVETPAAMVPAAAPAAPAPAAAAPAQAPAPAPAAAPAPAPGPAPAPAPASNVYPMAPVPGMVLPAGRTVPLNIGFQGDFFNNQLRPRGIDAVRQSGVQWAKQQVVWSQYEISAAECAKDAGNCFNVTVNGRPHAYKQNQFSYLDAVIADLTNANLNVLVSVVRSPDFLAAPGGHSPADPNNLRDFLQVLVTRYRGKVKAVEPWNEQNLAGEWGATRLWPNAPAAPPQGAVDFLALMKAAYQGIKDADPQVIVVLPALTPTGVGECWANPDVRASSGCIDQVKIAIDDRLYLDLLYQVNNAEITRYYDVLGVHPSGYNNPPDDTPEKKTVPSTGFKGHPSFYPRRFQQLREVQVKYGDAKPMWFTEVGWSSTRIAVPGYEYAQENSEAQRGKYLARLLEIVMNETPYVTNVIIWNLNFRQVVPESDEKYGFGLLERDGSPTVGYGCIADFAKSGGKITQAQCR